MNETETAIADAVRNRVAGALKQAGANEQLTDEQIDGHAADMARLFALDAARSYSADVVAGLAGSGETDE